MWRLALLVVLALSVRAQDVINLRSMPLAEDSDRLLTSVRQPVIVEANVPNITVGFKTGPNIPGTHFTIKCVLEGEACDAPAQGQPVSGSLPVKPAAVEGTVQGLEVDQTYSCFVETTLSENGKVSFCQEATPTPGIVRFELKFPGYRDAAAFGQQDREQVCANVLSLQPGGTCTVLRVVNGSAIVFIQVEDDDYRNTWSLTETLAQNDTEVTAALTSGLEGSVEIADIQTEPPLPSPLPPTDVTANPSSDCMPSVTVTWTAPQRSSTITGYFVSCKSMTAPTANSTVAATQRNVSLPIQAGEEYMCSVVSQGPSGTSVPADASSLVMYKYPGSCFTLCDVSQIDLLYSQNFEENADGWFEVTAGNAVTWITGFSPEFDGKSGVGQLIMENTESNAGPFTGFRQTGSEPVGIILNETMDGIILQLAFYLNVSDTNGLTNDMRIDYSIAPQTIRGDAFVRDYMFNFGFYDDDTGPGSGERRFVVSTSNNSPGFPKNPDKDPISINQSGWYIFRHNFYPQGEDVDVQLSIFDSDCGLVKSWTPQKVTVSGDGNRDLEASEPFYVRYGWIVNNELPTDSLTIDGQVYAKVIA
eukprot:jgi/Picre1/33803/NNA_001282.t1